jgi:hypothetical protein
LGAGDPVSGQCVGRGAGRSTYEEGACDLQVYISVFSIHGRLAREVMMQRLSEIRRL